MRRSSGGVGGGGKRGAFMSFGGETAGACSVGRLLYLEHRQEDPRAKRNWGSIWGLSGG